MIFKNFRNFKYNNNILKFIFEINNIIFISYKNKIIIFLIIKIIDLNKIKNKFKC